MAVEAGRCEQLIQQLARTPDKGLAPLVLLGPRGLTDQHQPRQGVAAAEHHPLAAEGQGAAAAGLALLGQGVQSGLAGPGRTPSRDRQARADGEGRCRQAVDGADLAGMARFPWHQGKGHGNLAPKGVFGTYVVAGVGQDARLSRHSSGCRPRRCTDAAPD